MIEQATSEATAVVPKIERPRHDAGDDQRCNRDPSADGRDAGARDMRRPTSDGSADSHLPISLRPVTFCASYPAIRLLRDYADRCPALGANLLLATQAVMSLRRK